jgi:hypothetical protein
MPRSVRSSRAARPRRASGGGTTTARGATFAQTTHGTGLTPIPVKAAGPLGESYRGKFGQYDSICQGWIAMTLDNPVFGPRVNFHNVGTGPELVTCGFFLARGYVPHRNITFQEDKIIIDDRSRLVRKEFVVDVEVDSIWGEFLYLNIDGVFFHSRTELQEFKDHIRDSSEQRKGTPIDVPDTVCYDSSTFMTFLRTHGVLA